MNFRPLLPLFVLLLSACLSSTEKEKNTVSIGTQGATGTGDITEELSVVTAMPSGTIVDPVHGKEIGLAYGPLSGTSLSANGVVSAHYLEDATTIVGLQLNIAVPQDGWFYEAWLEKDAHTPWISLGHLSNPLNDVRHSVRFVSKETLNSYRTVHITLEEDDGDSSPGTTVAGGILKATTR